jgi:hypothetical protein
VLFGSKVVHWVFSDRIFPPASALVRGFLFVLLLDFVERLRDSARDVEIRMRELPGCEMGVRRG